MLSGNIVYLFTLTSKYCNYINDKLLLLLLLFLINTRNNQHTHQIISIYINELMIKLHGKRLISFHLKFSFLDFEKDEETKIKEIQFQLKFMIIFIMLP